MTISHVDSDHLNLSFSINFEEELNEISFTLTKESTNYYLELNSMNQSLNKQKEEIERINLINKNILEENKLLKNEI